MKAHVLRGSKQEIAQNLVQLAGEVSEAIVFVQEPAPETSETGTLEAKDVFAEMSSYMVDAQDVEDSRETIYSRMDGE